MSRFPRVPIALAAIVFAIAGVLASGVPARAASDYSLVTLPDQGESAIYDFVNTATSSIEVTIYELKDTTLVNDLVAREKAGVNVRVIMDDQHQSYDQDAYNTLTAAGAGVVWSNPSFTYTHQKTITVDDKESYISTGNFDTTYYSTSRDFGVFDTDANDVSAIVGVFNADYQHSSITPSDGDDLVWSPTDSQTQIVNLINSATTSLDLEQEEFSATAPINALVAAAQRGVKVRVVLEDPSDYSSEVTKLENAGGQVVGYSDPNGFYIHAKTIIADYGTSNARAFAGSENLSNNSLEDNRELGLITGDSGVVSGLESAFGSDWAGAGGGGGGGGGGTCSGNLLGNPGFETGAASPWSASSGVIYSGTKEPARTGSYDAWLDGYGKTTTDTLSQTVTLPAGCASYTFSFWMHIDTAETTTSAKNDTLTLQVLDSSGNKLSQLYTYSNLNANTGYAQHTFTTLGDYAGQTITLKFTGSENAQDQTSFVIDDTALNVS